MASEEHARSYAGMRRSEADASCEVVVRGSLNAESVDDFAVDLKAQARSIGHTMPRYLPRIN